VTQALSSGLVGKRSWEKPVSTHESSTKSLPARLDKRPQKSHARRSCANPETNLRTTSSLIRFHCKICVINQSRIFLLGVNLNLVVCKTMLVLYRSPFWSTVVYRYVSSVNTSELHLEHLDLPLLLLISVTKSSAELSWYGSRCTEVDNMVNRLAARWKLRSTVSRTAVERHRTTIILHIGSTDKTRHATKDSGSFNHTFLCGKYSPQITNILSTPHVFCEKKTYRMG
jgi:hypothetical protein